MLANGLRERKDYYLDTHARGGPAGPVPAPRSPAAVTCASTVSVRTRTVVGGMSVPVRLTAQAWPMGIGAELVGADLGPADDLAGEARPAPSWPGAPDRTPFCGLRRRTEDVSPAHRGAAADTGASLSKPTGAGPTGPPLPVGISDRGDRGAGLALAQGQHAGTPCLLLSTGLPPGVGAVSSHRAAELLQFIGLGASRVPLGGDAVRDARSS